MQSGEIVSNKIETRTAIIIDGSNPPGAVKRAHYPYGYGIASRLVSLAQSAERSVEARCA